MGAIISQFMAILRNRAAAKRTRQDLRRLQRDIAWLNHRCVKAGACRHCHGVGRLWYIETASQELFSAPCEGCDGKAFPLERALAQQ